jgi:hypothetical protein
MFFFVFLENLVCSFSEYYKRVIDARKKITKAIWIFYIIMEHKSVAYIMWSVSVMSSLFLPVKNGQSGARTRALFIYIHISVHMYINITHNHEKAVIMVNDQMTVITIAS